MHLAEPLLQRDSHLGVESGALCEEVFRGLFELLGVPEVEGEGEGEGEGECEGRVELLGVPGAG